MNIELEEEKEEFKLIDKHKGTVEYIVLPNYKKRKLLTDEEVKFYTYLNQLTIKYDYMPLAQVSLSQLVEVNNVHNYWHLLGRIKQLVIDFVIYDKYKEQVICCIELDDETHFMEKRKRRDKFVNEVLEDAKIPLIRITRKENYQEDIKNLENRIIEYTKI